MSASLDGAARRRLVDVLERSQAAGALGPGPVDPHIDHALGMAGCADEPPGRFLDLGTGGGVPGLVLLCAWPETEAILVESQGRRARLLTAAAAALGAESRCRVVDDRAEMVGRRPGCREVFDIVTARAFGAPAVTAECGAPLVRVGGWLVVSEPPRGMGERWPEDRLEELGLAAPESCGARASGAVRMQKTAPCDARWPRRVGIPAKRPLW